MTAQKFSAYLRGMTKYDLRVPVAEVTDPDERRGWWAACNADAEFEANKQEEVSRGRQN
jgi:hypothetical protein